MKKNGILFGLLLILSLISCCTFSVKRTIPKPVGTFKTISEEDYNLEVDVLDSETSKKLFGIDFKEIGIRTLNVGIENKSDYPIEYDGSKTYLQDEGNYTYKPFNSIDLAEAIYKSDKFKYMVKQGSKDGLIFGILGAAIGATAGAVFGKAEEVGPWTVKRDRAGGSVAGAAVGGAVGAAAGVVKGVMQAKEKAIDQIANELMKSFFRPDQILPGTKQSGLLFFQSGDRELVRLKVGISVKKPEAPLKEKLELELDVVVN